MADQPLTIEAINWREAFPFTNIFRAFRVAIHPSKIVLGLVALVLLYTGGRLLDGCWPIDDRAVPNAASLFETFHKQANPIGRFSDVRNDNRSETRTLYAQELLRYQVVSDDAAAQ